MSKTLTVVPAPDGIASRQEIKLALREGAPVRFEGWRLAGADLKGLDLRSASSRAAAEAARIFPSAIWRKRVSFRPTSTTAAGAGQVCPPRRSKTAN
jgi:hypothetical protein